MQFYLMIAFRLMLEAVDISYYVHLLIEQKLYQEHSEYLGESKNSCRSNTWNHEMPY